MKFMSIRDLRNYTGRFRKAVANENVTLTSNGRPFALMIGIGESEDPAELERLVRQAKVQAAVSRLRRETAEQGGDRLSPEEIDAEIRAAREQRREQ